MHTPVHAESITEKNEQIQSQYRGNDMRAFPTIFTQRQFQ